MGNKKTTNQENTAVDEQDVELRPFPPFLPPQATVMNISGQIGFCVAAGYRFSSVISIIGRTPLFIIVATETPTAISMRKRPKIG